MSGSPPSRFLSLMRATLGQGQVESLPNISCKGTETFAPASRARCHRASTSSVWTASAPTVPLTDSGESTPSSGNSSAIITVESPKRSSICINRPPGTGMRPRSSAPNARWYHAEAAPAPRTTRCGVIVCFGSVAGFVSVIACSSLRPGWPTGPYLGVRWGVAVVVDQGTGVAIGEAVGAEVVREAELDAADLLKTRQLLGGELHLQRPQVVLELVAPAGTQDRDDDT